MPQKYQICTRCIMDTTDPEIKFDENGVCNHCRNYEERARRELHSEEELKKLVNKIKTTGKDKKYDCLIGLSGGVDSTTVANLVKKLSLRPLAISLDNGWNTEISERNMKNIVEQLGIDFKNYKVDWNEFRDLQISFLRASVPNVEISTDHAIAALLYKTAVKNKIKYIITGGNIATEAIMPESWGYSPLDLRYLKSIHKRFGKVKLKNFTTLSIFNWLYNTFVRRIKQIPILNYTNYVRKEAKERLKNLGWEDYGLKHYESIYTRFFQGYILPTKFGFDKRRAHFSTLINSGQMTREEALEEMKHSPYLNEEMMREDREYVIKKLGLTNEEFENIMKQPVKSYKDYPNNSFLFKKLSFFVKLAKKIITSS